VIERDRRTETHRRTDYR